MQRVLGAFVGTAETMASSAVESNAMQKTKRLPLLIEWKTKLYLRVTQEVKLFFYQTN